MPVDAGYASLSDNLLVVTIMAYAVAMLLYAVEYAFGDRGRVAAAAAVVAPSEHAARVLVGAGGPSSMSDPTGVVPTAAPSRRRMLAFGRMAVFLTVVGWAAHLGCLTFRGLAVGRAPWGNMYEFAVAATLVAVTGYLVLLYRQPVRYLGAFVMVPVVLLLGLAGTVLYTRAAPLMPALQSYWLWIHVSMITLACGIFLVGFSTSVLYLIRARYEQRAGSASMRFPTTLGARLPAADRLEQVTFRVIALGFPILTFAVIAGAIWAEAAWGRYWGWDPKETWAFITWVIYAAYLHARSTAGWRGGRAIGIALLGWAAMMFNLFGVNILISGLHSYAGLS